MAMNRPNDMKNHWCPRVLPETSCILAALSSPSAFTSPQPLPALGRPPAGSSGGAFRFLQSQWWGGADDGDADRKREREKLK